MEKRDTAIRKMDAWGASWFGPSLHSIVTLKSGRLIPGGLLVDALFPAGSVESPNLRGCACLGRGRMDEGLQGGDGLDGLNGVDGVLGDCFRGAWGNWMDWRGCLGGRRRRQGL